MAGERTVKIRFTGESKGLDATTERSARGLERWEKQADKMAAAAGRVQRVVGAMIGPGAVPAIASAAGAAAGLAASAGAAGAAVGVFAKVLGASQTEVTEAATQLETLGDKVTKYENLAAEMARQGKDNASVLKQQAAAQLELDAALAGLEPGVRGAAQAYLRMNAAVDGFVKANEPVSLGLLQRGYALVANNVGKLQPLYDIGARAAGRALAAVERFAAGGGIDRFVQFLARNAVPAMDSLGRIGRNVFTFLGVLFKETADDGQGLLDVIANASDRLASFSTGGGLTELIDRVTSNGPAAGQALVQIGQAAVTIAQAIGPLAPVSIAVATALATIIAAIPPGVITALVAAWIAYTAAMAGYNAVMTIVTTATKVWTGVQAAFNAVMALNPVTLIIIAIAALIAIIVLIATKTTWFQDLWRVVWGAIQSAAKAVGDWFVNTLWPSLKRAFDQLMAVVKFVVSVWQAQWRLLAAIGQWLWDKYKAYIAGLVKTIMLIVGAVQRVYNSGRDYFNRLVSYIGSLPGRIASATRGMFDGVKNAFRSAINYVIDRWNNLSFSLPSISTPFGNIGGFTLNTPNIGRLATGGWAQPGRTYLTGENGPELISVGRRSYVHNAGDTAGMSAPPVVHVYIGDRELTDIVDVRIESSDRQKLRRAGTRVAGAFA